ncbi:MAG: hypothetical protein PVH65_15790, partial [Chloroflexota bacterium]|jgi:DNA gyrase/topoisomerase IV subunit A
MIEPLEGPTPYKFDRPLPGAPAAIFGAAEDDQLVLLLDSGRAVRYPAGQMPTQGLQAIKRREDEQLTGAVLAREEDQLLLLTGSGYGRRLLGGMVPVPPRANSRGRVVVARRPVCGLARLEPGQQAWAITDRRWLALDPGRLPAAETDSTRSQRLARLTAGEAIHAAFTNSM